jgi:uncharacterized protein YhaN
VVTSARQAADRRELLASQKVRAEATLAENRQRREEAHQAMAAWRRNCGTTSPSPTCPPLPLSGALQEALDLFAEMHRDLDKIRELRVNRIDMMRRDLADFAEAAQALARGLDLDLARQAADGIALTLGRRLQQETAAAQERDRLLAALTQATEAAQADRTASRRPRPPWTPCGSACLRGPTWPPCGRPSSARIASASSAPNAIRPSAQLLKDGDGLDRGALEAEWAATDVPAIPARLEALKQEIDQRVSQQNQWTADLRQPEAALERIAGQDEAAQAEARRQEALARMGNAVERFIRVHTAAKLLRWSIERFREHKQGPLLARASDIFRGLTGGALERLQVDYDHQPPTLLGQRPTGARVHIEGMSEGTRDQLYLALRLAALELHLRQTPALPFIADDLFINYDNGRARAGFAALADLSRLTQVIFLSHHHHLVDLASDVFGGT